ncbi:MAG: PAS domain S-box protein [Cytophagaceae bacterium]
MPIITLNLSNEPREENGFLRKFNLYRIILLLSISFSLLLRYIFMQENPDTVDPWHVRMIFSGILLLLFGLSFFKALSNRIIHLTYLTFFCYSIYGLLLLHKNNFSIGYILEFILLVMIVCISFDRKVYVYLFLSSAFVLYVIALYSVCGLSADFAVKAFLMVIVNAAIILFFLSKIEMENRLAVREDLLRTIYNEAPDALLLCDPASSLVMSCNERTLSIFGLKDVNEIVNKNLNHLLKYPYTPGAWQNLKKKVQQKKFLIQEAEFKTPAGNCFWGSEAITEIIVEGDVYWLIRVTDITEKVRDKKLIEESRKILRQVIDLVPHQIFLKDNQGRFLIVNKAVSDKYNTTTEEMVGKRDSDFSDKEEAEQFMKADREVIESGVQKFVPEEVLTDFKGNKLYLQTTKMPFYFDEDRKPGLLGIAIDITTLKLAEKAILQSEAKFKMLMEQASDGIYLADENGHIIEANPRACDMFGYSQEELLSKNIKELSWSGIKDSSLLFFPSPSDKQSFIIERTFIRKDGTPFTVEMSARLLDDGKHQAIIRDITERKRLEAVLKDNERRFRALIENSSDIILILTEDFKINFVSSSVRRLIGLKPEMLIGKRVFEMVHMEEIDKVSKFLADLKSKPGINQSLEEVKVLKAGGGVIFLEIVAVNMLDDQVINGIIVNCHDITKRKITENELLNTNYELDSFVYKASHDLKAPLRSVMGLIKLAKLENKDSTQHMYLDMMNKSVISLDTFIRDLTQFSRNSRAELNPQLVNFEEVLDEVFHNLKFMDHADKITVKRNLIIKQNFYSDIQRITTIFNNLISNAIKYHRFENNIPYIDILISADYDQAVIVVEDNGSGIDPVHVERVFEMFYRASETSYGSGLGLYIVKNAVAKLGGRVELESMPGRGSKFVVTIPNLLNDIKVVEVERKINSNINN